MRILLVENNAGDASLFRECSSDVESLSLRWLDSVESALNLLRGKASAEPEPLPDLIVTDLSVQRPKGATGLDFIQELRNDPQLREIPIAVLTGSPWNVQESELERLGIRRYYRKPMYVAAWRTIVRDLVNSV